MKTALLFFYLGSLLVSAVAGLVYKAYFKNRLPLLFVPYLLLVFLQELIMYIYGERWLPASNNVVYNIYKPVTILVFAIVYYSIPFMIRFRKWIVLLTVVYLLLLVITFLFLDSIYSTNSYLTLARGIVITFYAVFFLFSYFNLDNSREEKFWTPLLWITIGIVSFYPVISISLTFQKALAADNATFYGFKLYQLIPQLMSIFMYACFAYAFYLCKEKK